jgi:hypothetical protein
MDDCHGQSKETLMAGRIIAALRAVVATMANVLFLPFRVFARLLGLSHKGRPGAGGRSGD